MQKNCLKQLNSLDVARQVKWHFRKLRDTDTSADFCLKRRLAFYNINFVIDIIQIDTEVAEDGELLPAYTSTSMGDVVLDVGPAVVQVPGNMSHYLSSSSSSSAQLPTYEHHYGISLPLLPPPPPAYFQHEERSSSLPVNLTSSRNMI